MIGYARKHRADMPSSTLEADLTDWAEQHHTVTLPDDEYPHVGQDPFAAGL